MAGANLAAEAGGGCKEFGADDPGVEGLALIVLDASAVVELLTEGPAADAVRTALLEADDVIAAPHLLDVEVSSAVRGLSLSGLIDATHGSALLSELADLPIERFPHTPLLPRIWELRHNFTAYDAAYIALAEATGSVLCTTDTKLGTGHRAHVLVLTGHEGKK